MLIEDKIWGNIIIPEKYECILNSKEINDLKEKKQLGMTKGENVIHTRFDHSLGVYYLACKLINIVKEKLGNYIKITVEEEDAIKIMALTHDIGHGPFSHLAERLLSGSHEDNTIRLLKSNTEIHNQILNNFGENVLDKVIYLIELKEKVKDNKLIYDKLDIMFIISKLLSGGIDIDRLDYIARDSYHVIGEKHDYSNILNYINLDYVDDYLEIVFDEKAEYLIANYLNKRYELYDTVYLDEKKFLVESCLDKILKKIKYPIDWSTKETDIMNYFNENKQLFNYAEQRFIEIVLNKEINDDVKYVTFNNSKEYSYFLSRLSRKYSDFYKLNELLLITHNKLNIYNNKNRIYINHGNMITDMNECAILNSRLQRDKYIIGIDFNLIDYYYGNSACYDSNQVKKLKQEFSIPLELEKKYLYSNPDKIEQYQKIMFESLKLDNGEEVINNDTYYDYDSILKDSGITIRHRVTKNKDIWNIKEPITDKSSITKRKEIKFDSLEEVIEYLNIIKNIDIRELQETYSSITKRMQYKLNINNAEFEIAFDKVNVISPSNDINFDMVECELKKGKCINLYYINKLFHNEFPFLIDCRNSKNEMLINNINMNNNIKRKIKNVNK